MTSKMRRRGLLLAGALLCGALGRAAPADVPLLEGTFSSGLPKIIEKDWRGAGAEAARAQAWARGRTGLSLSRGERDSRLADSSGASMSLSAELASALEHINQFLAMMGPTLERPISREELEAAVLSPEGIAAIQAIFERAARDGVVIDGRWTSLETGGEAALDGTLSFHEMPDSSRLVFDRLRAALDDSAGMLKHAEEIVSLYQGQAAAMGDIDPTGILRGILGRLPEMEARGVPAQRRERLLRLAVRNTIENSADSWTHDPDVQFKVIAEDEWSGRYVGAWHTHPMVYSSDGWSPSTGPSGPDMDNARASGQFLTLAFHPEGFDFYDLSGLAGAVVSDPAKIRKTSLRSPIWREHFERLRREIVVGFR